MDGIGDVFCFWGFVVILNVFDFFLVFGVVWCFKFWIGLGVVLGRIFCLCKD